VLYLGKVSMHVKERSSKWINTQKKSKLKICFIPKIIASHQKITSYLRNRMLQAKDVMEVTKMTRMFLYA